MPPDQRHHRSLVQRLHSCKMQLPQPKARYLLTVHRTLWPSHVCAATVCSPTPPNTPRPFPTMNVRHSTRNVCKIVARIQLVLRLARQIVHVGLEILSGIPPPQRPWLPLQLEHRKRAQRSTPDFLDKRRLPRTMLRRKCRILLSTSVVFMDSYWSLLWYPEVSLSCYE